jgi:sec-independent protein translocase protein TatA
MDIPVMLAVKFLGIGALELTIILGIALLIFGPKNLPKLGETLGKTVKGVRDGMDNKELEQPPVVEEVVAKDEEEDDDEYEEVVIRRKKTDSEN